MEIGNKVSWTKQTLSGRTMELKQMEGVIIEIEKDVAIVKYGGNNRRKRIHLSRLRLAKEKSELSEAVEYLIQANRE